MSKQVKFKVGRDAATGRFLVVKEAAKDPRNLIPVSEKFASRMSRISNRSGSTHMAETVARKAK